MSTNAVVAVPCYGLFVDADLFMKFHDGPMLKRKQKYELGLTIKPINVKN